jgi:hypothetical protein
MRGQYQAKKWGQFARNLQVTSKIQNIYFLQSLLLSEECARIALMILNVYYDGISANFPVPQPPPQPKPSC